MPDEVITLEDAITTVKSLVDEIDLIFSQNYEWLERKEKITIALRKVDFSTTESNKYTFFDAEKPYTRNLIATDNKNYTLLFLCWNPGRESKIHNHPCDGCFIKTLAGCIKETKYAVDVKNNSIRLSGVKFFCENQVSYMADEIGLHKIGNPNKDIGAVTLHLYTPPFSVCKVWSNSGEGQYSKHEEGKVGYFSVYGHRSPHLEGRPGLHAKLMEEIRTPFVGEGSHI